MESLHLFTSKKMMRLRSWDGDSCLRGLCSTLYVSHKVASERKFMILCFNLNCCMLQKPSFLHVLACEYAKLKRTILVVDSAIARLLEYFLRCKINQPPENWMPSIAACAVWWVFSSYDDPHCSFWCINSTSSVVHHGKSRKLRKWDAGVSQCEGVWWSLRILNCICFVSVVSRWCAMRK